ncbi:hypothetical protein Ancab_033158, partial [Ancistrocladus abbreviatus]
KRFIHSKGRRIEKGVATMGSGGKRKGERVAWGCLCCGKGSGRQGPMGLVIGEWGIPLHVQTDEFFKQVTGEWGIFMAVDNNTKDRRCLEFARILIHTSCISMINSKLEVRVDGDVVPVWAAEEVSSFDDYNVLSGINERHVMFSTSSSYVVDSMSSQKLTGKRAPVTLAVENCPTVVHQREVVVAADLSISLQKRIQSS